MNDYLLSVILGIVEGLTEFLPVSSTAHLRIVEKLLRVDLGSPYWKMYTVVIQLGAILSVVVYFWSRLVAFAKSFRQEIARGEPIANHPLTLVCVAFAVTAIPAFLLSKVIGKNLESLWVIGTALLVGGVVMWAVDAICTRPRILEMDRMGLPQAVWVGLIQILSAVFPGTSRSMSTIAAGQTAGMSRSAALEFSFFLCIPTMFAATGYELAKTVLKKGGPDHVVMTSHDWVVLGIGFVVSFFVAWGVIAWFMAWVRKHGFVPFAVYRIVVGIGVLVWVKYPEIFARR